MLALAAFVCFILVVFGVSTSFSLIALGLALLTLHLMFGWWPFVGERPWRRG